MEVGSIAESGWRRWLRSPSILAVILALVHPAATALARVDWRVDMLTHFVGPGLALSLVAAGLVVVTWRGHRRWWAVGLLALATWQGSVAFRYDGANPVPAAGAGRGRLRLLVLNVQKDNRRTDAIAALIRDERPDVVGLVEVSPHHVAGLDALGIGLEYPFRMVHPLGGQGLMLLFRDPPLGLFPPTILAPEGNPVARATVRVGDLAVSLWLAHPPNPIGTGRARADGDLVALGEAIGRSEGPRILVGDLNRSEGSPHFADLLRASGLRDGRLGFGREPSWPAWSPYRIAIDHTLVSPELAVAWRRVGPDVGSDHLPVLIEVGPAEPGGEGGPTSSANRSAHQPRSSGGGAGSPENLDRSTAPR